MKTSNVIAIALVALSFAGCGKESKASSDKDDRSAVNYELKRIDPKKYTELDDDALVKKVADLDKALGISDEDGNDAAKDIVAESGGKLDEKKRRGFVNTLILYDAFQAIPISHAVVTSVLERVDSSRYGDMSADDAIVLLPGIAELHGILDGINTPSADMADYIMDDYLDASPEKRENTIRRFQEKAEKYKFVREVLVSSGISRKDAEEGLARFVFEHGSGLELNQFWENEKTFSKIKCNDFDALVTDCRKLRKILSSVEEAAGKNMSEPLINYMATPADEREKALLQMEVYVQVFKNQRGESGDFAAALQAREMAERVSKNLATPVRGRNKTVAEGSSDLSGKGKGRSEKGTGEDYSDPKAFFKKYFMEDWFNPRYGSESYKKAMRFKEIRVDNLRLDVSLGMSAVCADVRIIPEPGVVYINKRIEPWHILTTEGWDASLSGSKLDGNSYLRAEVTIRRVKLDNGVFVPAEPVRDRGGLNYAVQGFGFLDDLRVYKPSDSEIMTEMLRRTVEEVEKTAEKNDNTAARHGLDEYVWTEYSYGNQFRFIHDTTLKRRLYVALKKLIAIAGWNAEKVKHHKISNILRLLSRDVEKVKDIQGMSPREHLLQALREADFEDARKPAITVLENDPYDPDANFAIGMWHYQLKRWGEAEKYLLRCLDNKPKSPSVWNNLAMVYLEQKKLDVARQYAYKALSLLPRSEEIKDTINRIATAAEHGRSRGSALNIEANGGKTNLYLVIDLSRGMNASSYPVSYLDEVPKGGWSTEYKTSKLVLRRISPGKFKMGSPDVEIGHSAREVLHEVTITKPFYIGVFPVTQRQYELVTGKMPSYFFNVSCYEARPVERVTWNDIRGESSTYDWPESSDVDSSTFIGLLRRKTGIRTFDLPTEAKWEYSCRAGSTSALNSGKGVTAKAIQDANVDEVGRYAGNFPSGNVHYSHGSDLSAGTATVGSYLPNAWGLYDMHGNVFEWCLDWYDEFSTDAVSDPVGPPSGTYRICRGGSWFRGASYCRSASRNWRSPSHEHNFDNGFRVCCDIMSATTTTNTVRSQAKRPIGMRYTPVSTNKATVAETLEELNGLIGLKPVKDSLAQFAKTISLDQQRKMAGLKTLPMSYNMVFTGNPGTGKTTVARIMAKLYKSLGVLKIGHFVEADRSGLVAGNEAQTVLKTGRVIDLALDGVLFIDAANFLSKGPKDRCGNAAIATLLKRMDDDRDRLVVILAGGAEELKQFLGANAGLSSRFTHYVEFPDYTAEELTMMLDLDYRLLDRKSAERHALQILRLDAGHAFANYVMGSIFLKKGKLKDAEKYLRTSVAASRPLAVAQNDLAEVLRQTKRLAEAEKFAREAKNTDPKLYVAWETLCATLLDQNKNLDEAEQCMRKAIELSKGKDIRMQLTLARVQLAKMDVVKARDTLRSLDKCQLTDERDRAMFDKLMKKAQGR